METQQYFHCSATYYVQWHDYNLDFVFAEECVNIWYSHSYSDLWKFTGQSIQVPVS